MGLNISALEKYSDEFIKFIDITDTYVEFIGGIPSYTIVTPDQYGEEKENVMVEMDALYRYHKNHPEAGIDKKFISAMDKSTKCVKSTDGFVSILEKLSFQLYAEKHGIASFSMDTKHMLENLSKNLIENAELYNTEIYDSHNFWPTIERYNADISEKFGHKIM